MADLDWDFERENWQFAKGLVNKCRTALEDKDWKNVEFYYKMMLKEATLSIFNWNTRKQGFQEEVKILKHALDTGYENNLTSILEGIQPNVGLIYSQFCLDVSAKLLGY